MSDHPWRDAGWDDDIMREVWEAMFPVYREAAVMCATIADAMGDREVADKFRAAARSFGAGLEGVE